MYSLLIGIPIFYWFRECNSIHIKEMLKEALSFHPQAEKVGTIVSVSGFLGEKFHKSMVKQIGDYADRLAPSKLTIPHDGPRTFFGAEIATPHRNQNSSMSEALSKLEKELDGIAASAENSTSHQPSLPSRWRARTIDCLLYAQVDRYVIKGKQ